MSEVALAVPRRPFLPLLFANLERGQEHRSLSLIPNCDERLVWEPPIFDYSHLIDEEYEKKREGVLKYTGGDVATVIMDLHTCRALLFMYREWIDWNGGFTDDRKKRVLMAALWIEVFKDEDIVETEELEKAHVGFTKQEDWTWLVENWDSYLRRNGWSDEQLRQQIGPGLLFPSLSNEPPIRTDRGASNTEEASGVPSVGSVSAFETPWGGDEV